jgi:glycosyltransferase involved in cell wall biosynthesis
MGGSIGDQGRPIALFLSRIHPKKGLERLLPHWPELLKRHPTLLLVIAGTGEPAHVQRVQEVARQHGLINSVLFVGQLSGAAKSQAMADADVFILPSYQEGFSMAIAEAMAAGLPVVITRECNFGEVEEVEAGAVIAHGDMPAFVGAVAKLLENPTARFISGRNGQRLVRSRFSWEAAAERLEKLYRAVSQRSQIPQNLMPPEISRASDSTAD